MEVRVVFGYWLVENIPGVEIYSDGVIKSDVIIEDTGCEVVSCYCPQTGRSTTEREEFYELMNKVVVSEVLAEGNFNDHAGCDVGDFGFNSREFLD